MRLWLALPKLFLPIKEDTTLEKPKFKMSLSEMVDFDNACDEAANECPQYSGSWSKLDTLINENLKKTAFSISAKKLVEHWWDCNILFGSGYKKYLSDEAKEVFRKYNLYRAQKLVYKASL